MLAPVAPAPRTAQGGVLNGYVAFVVADAAPEPEPEPEIVLPFIVFNERTYAPRAKAYKYFTVFGQAAGARPKGHWNRFGDGRIKVWMTDAQLDRLAQWLEDK